MVIPAAFWLMPIPFMMAHQQRWSLLDGWDVLLLLPQRELSELSHWSKEKETLPCLAGFPLFLYLTQLVLRGGLCTGQLLQTTHHVCSSGIMWMGVEYIV